MSGYAATNGAAYERSMGRWSRKLADPMLDALALPRGSAVLDAGCGTGAMADALAARDPAARARVPGAEFRQGDLCALDLPDGIFDAALSLLVLQFVPDRAKAVAEMLRVTKPGGMVAAAMWDFTGGFSFLRAFADSVAITEPEGEAFRARYWADPVGAPGRMAAPIPRAGDRPECGRWLCMLPCGSDDFEACTMD